MLGWLYDRFRKHAPSNDHLDKVLDSVSHGSILIGIAIAAFVSLLVTLLISPCLLLDSPRSTFKAYACVDKIC